MGALLPTVTDFRKGASEGASAFRTQLFATIGAADMAVSALPKNIQLPKTLDEAKTRAEAGFEQAQRRVAALPTELATLREHLDRATVERRVNEAAARGEVVVERLRQQLPVDALVDGVREAARKSPVLAGVFVKNEPSAEPVAEDKKPAAKSTARKSTTTRRRTTKSSD